MQNTNEPHPAVSTNARIDSDILAYGFDPSAGRPGRGPYNNVLAPSHFSFDDIEKCLDIAEFPDGHIPRTGAIIIPAEDSKGEITYIFHYPTSYYPGSPRSNATIVEVAWPPGASDAEIENIGRRAKAFTQEDWDTVLFKECSICNEELSVGDIVIVLPCGDWFDQVCIEEKLRWRANCPNPTCKARVFKADGTVRPRMVLGP